MIKIYSREQIINWKEGFIDSQILGRKFNFKIISTEGDKPNKFIAFVVDQTLSTDKESSHLTIRLEGEKIEKEISLVNIQKMESVQ